MGLGFKGLGLGCRVLSLLLVGAVQLLVIVHVAGQVAFNILITSGG